MSQMSLQVTAPAGTGSAVPELPRSFAVAGTWSVQLSSGHGPVSGVQVDVQFGTGGPVLAASVSGQSWQCTGSLPAAVPPGASFTVTVSASAQVRFFHQPGEPDFETVTAQAVFSARLANPAPVLSIDEFAATASSASLPLDFLLAGSVADADGNLVAVQCRLDTGDFEAVSWVSGQGRWQQAFSLPAGLHRFTVRALDAAGNQALQERFLHVRPDPAPPDLNQGSITSWTRIEPDVRDASMAGPLCARVFDPLWLLARQWQMGEFQGQDAGTPVQARVRATSARINRCRLGPAEGGTVMPYDGTRMPLEALVERQPVRAAGTDDPALLPLVVEAGLQALRLLPAPTPARSRRAHFIRAYALQPLSADAAGAADDGTQRFMRSMAGRALDARRLAADLRQRDAGALVQDPALQIDPADQAATATALRQWLAWYDALITEPAGPAGDAWMPARMAYAVSVAGGLSTQAEDQVCLSAGDWADGRLDWSSFDLDPAAGLGSPAGADSEGVVDTVLPSPVTVRGAPAPRFWELEDSRLAYGLLPVDPADLGQLLAIEYASSYGNDWFVLPLDLALGTVTRIDSLVVTDSFGMRTLLKPIGRHDRPSAGFALWQHAHVESDDIAGPTLVEPNRFLLAPTLGAALEGPALERVLMMRDETANLAWAIEQQLESPLERPLPTARAAGPQPAAAAGVGPLPRYRLSTSVPPAWIPLLPMQIEPTPGQRQLRLQRGAVLQADGTQRVHSARGRLLGDLQQQLLRDADLPRDGLQLSRGRRLTRWIDGSTWLWTAVRQQVGRGEGSSGLQFDRVWAPGERVDS